MKTKIILFFTLFIVSTAGVSAQNDFKALASSDDFKKKLSEESVSLKSIESDFVQTKYMELLSEKIVSKGTFYYKKDNKICLDYTSPVKYLIVINGKKVKIAADGKTNIYDIGKNKMMAQMNSLISACMTGNLNELTSDYQLIFKENNSQYWIQVQPQGSVKSYMKSIDIFLDKKDFSVQRLKMTEASNDYTEYIFTNKKKNAAIPDAKFSLK
jgi:outer membrane lipoprotein-sorting protein